MTAWESEVEKMRHWRSDFPLCKFVIICITNSAKAKYMKY